MNERNNAPLKAPPIRGVRDEKRWTLLFMGDRGKTITFYHFKGIVVTALLVVIASLAVAGWFYYLYREGLVESQRLGTEIKNLKRALASERHEKEIITARLVVSESRLEKSRVKLKPEKPTEKPKEEPAAAPPKPAEKQVPEPPSPPVAISAENFLVFYEPDINSLRVEYKVVNTGSRNQPVSGRTVVVLKDEDETPDKWLVLPRVPMFAGRPAGDMGRSFTIRNYRTIRFKSDNQVGPDQFKTATVYIFTTTGELILEKEYPVGIKANTISQAPIPRQPSQTAPGNASAPPPREQEPRKVTDAGQQRSTGATTTAEKKSQTLPSTDSYGETIGQGPMTAVEQKPTDASTPSASSPEPVETRPPAAGEKLDLDVRLP